MPKIPHTMRRQQTYYLRQRIPTDLIPAYGGKKDIVKSLGTTNPAEARRRVHIELIHLDSEFAEKRKTQIKPALKRTLTSLSDAEIASMVLRWHQEQTTATETQILRELTPDLGRREEIIETLQEELGEAHIRQMHGIEYLQNAINLLNDQKIAFDENSDQFKKLQLLLSKASKDLLVRSLQHYQGNTVLGAGDPFFSQAQQRAVEKSISFKQLCDMYEHHKRDASLKPRSLISMRAEIAFLRNFILDDTDIKQIDRAKCREIFDALKEVPANITKIYPGKTIQQAIICARKDKARTLSPRTINGHTSRLASLFKFAQDEGLLSANPALSLIIRDTEKPQDKRKSFTIDDLNKIFNAPLYTGCIDDENGYHKSGNAHPRHHRFWVPIIGLYTGLRLEEICTLQPDDIRLDNGIYVLDVKHALKTEYSKRTIPVHPELIKIGLIEFTQAAKEKAHPRIFPELELKTKYSYSHPVSRWFGRFLDNLGIADSKKVFHSFRHTYRDALTEAKISVQFAEALCGWSSKAMSVRYGSGVSIPLLYEQICNVRYEGLDLSHLHIQPPQ